MVKRFLERKKAEGEKILYLERFNKLKTLEIKLQGCRLCRLGNIRNKLVFGEGNRKSNIIFVGEAPGKVEDQKGKPFVGRAGQLLRKLLAEVGFDPKQIYITNVVKCHPPYDRDPKKDEIKACMPYLKKQIELIKPKAIVTLGKHSTQALLDQQILITKIHGQQFEVDDIKIYPVFHPAYLVRNPNAINTTRNELSKVYNSVGVQNE